MSVRRFCNERLVKTVPQFSNRKISSAKNFHNIRGNGLFAARIWSTQLVVPRPIKSINRCIKFNTIARTCTRSPSSDTPFKQMLVTCISACLMPLHGTHTNASSLPSWFTYNSSNHTELLTFSCVRSTVRSESWQPLDCSLTHTVVVSTATFFYTSLVPRPLEPLVGLLVWNFELWTLYFREL